MDFAHMYCAHCGHEIVPRVDFSDGQEATAAWVVFPKCSCEGANQTHGGAYWYDQPPTSEDLKITIQLGVLPKQHRQYWLYQNPLWLGRPHAPIAKT